MLGHKSLLGTLIALKVPGVSLYRSCKGALLSHTHDRADCQYDVSVLDGRWSHNAQEPCSLLEGHFRCLKPDGRVELVGYSEVMLVARRARSGNIFADGVLVNSCSRRQSVVATSSSAGEFYAAAAVAEHPLHLKTVLEVFPRDQRQNQTRLLCGEGDHQARKSWQRVLLGNTCVVASAISSKGTVRTRNGAIGRQPGGSLDEDPPS